MTVGFSRMTSSRFSLSRVLWPPMILRSGSDTRPGRPLSVVCTDWRISPPMAMIWPSRARTTASVSLTSLLARGSVKLPWVPRLSTLLRSLTVLTAGCTCSVMKPLESMCGVTSSEMPLKKGCTVMLGLLLVVLPTGDVVVDTLVTKKSSVPTFSTAFWLFMVAMRGLDSTCVCPWVPRKSSTAAKLLVRKASPSSEPGAVAAASMDCPGSADTRPLMSWPVCPSWLPGPTMPIDAPVLLPALKADQLMPERSLSRSVTSTTLASSIPCRWTDARVVSR